MTGLRISYEGAISTAYQIKAALEAEGLSAEFVGGPPMENRQARQPLDWVEMYVATKAVDATLGQPIERAFRVAVQRIVDEFKARYPHIRLSIEDERQRS